MNRCCAVIRCNRVLHLTKLSESFFKSGKIFADRRDPARVQTVRHVTLLGFSDHRERYADLSDRSLSIVHELVSFLVAAANAPGGARLFCSWQTDHALARRRSPRDS